MVGGKSFMWHVAASAATRESKEREMEGQEEVRQRGNGHGIGGRGQGEGRVCRRAGETGKRKGIEGREGLCGGEKEGRGNYCVTEGEVEEGGRIIMLQRGKGRRVEELLVGKNQGKKIQGHPCPLVAETEEEVN